MTCCQTSLSLAFLHAVWTPKFWDWTSSSSSSKQPTPNFVTYLFLKTSWKPGLVSDQTCSQQSLMYSEFLTDDPFVCGPSLSTRSCDFSPAFSGPAYSNFHLMIGTLCRHEGSDCDGGPPIRRKFPAATVYWAVMAKVAKSAASTRPTR